ncbi:putative spermidine/putrescine transport system substrate-binding protein [Tranquillimonas rosea]|uniref:Putative spermidine/putrescine transport system substrate-binding protein n=1 Tax=Tranquillimonas rosea TaxID=641238 RepID=A0A1H9WKE4_9RHOB|nr:extracellular solute-binding protein [Tranquillimonas rosea]SES34147.1 putative spermidine/putrescine transport system substrate-binding protein [Tranquillimonas rosea]
MTKIRASRRGFLKGASAAGAAAAFPAPFVHAQEPVTLRYLSTAVNQSPGIAQKAGEELGINIEYIAVTTDDVARRVITQPNSFDLVDSEYFALPNLVPSGNLMGMDASRIERADDIASVITEGTVNGKEVGLQGTAPAEVFYLEGQNSQSFATEPTDWITLIPTTYNADTLGIRPDLIDKEISSWASLLDPDFAGKASILNIPSIGIMDAAMALEARGDITYGDKGNMTREEIDFTIEKLIEAKNAGQFRAFWSNFNESVNLMASGEVVIQSMWSPAVTAVRTQGVPCKYQPLQEGYRAWASGFGLPRTISDRKLDAAYEFVNWFLSGWAGAHLSRQGYYPAVLDTAKEFMEPYEWAYWYEGKEAEQDIMSPSGDLMEEAGAVRDGGSYEERMGAVACWNAVMDENQYMVRKWNEFIAA